MLLFNSHQAEQLLRAGSGHLADFVESVTEFMNACVDSQRQLDAATQPGINISPFITCKHLCTHLGPADGGLQSCDSACEACGGGGSVKVGLNAWMSERLPGERVSSWSDRHARTSDWGSAVSEFYLPAINTHHIFCLPLPVHLEIRRKMEINTVSSGLLLGRFEFGAIIIGIFLWNFLETSRKFQTPMTTSVPNTE